MISKEHLQNVCRPGQGADTCAYVTMGAGGYSCAKGTGIELLILGRLSAGTMKAQGDHCPGWVDDPESA